MVRGCPSIDHWHATVIGSGQWPAILGFSVVAICGLGFGAWAATAPLDGAVVTSGTFVAAGQNKVVQHLEGGIVKSVAVKEGDLVEAGQTLLQMDPTSATAKLRRLVLREYRLASTQARLRAELDGKDDFTLANYPGIDSTDPEMQTILQRQRIELGARRTTLANQQAVLRKEIAGLQDSITGYQSQIDATETRVKLFAEELKDKNSLLDRDLVRKTDILSIQRDIASLNGQLGELTGRAADSRQQIARADEQIASIRSTAVQKAIEELRETETELDDINSQISAAQDVVDRTDVKAPVRGIVVKLDQHTTGGVIAAGGTILELLPVNDDLIIEGRISPTQVTHVKDGQSASVRLSALNQRQTPMIGGHVIYLSADTISDRPMTPTSEPAANGSFVVRVKLDDKDLQSKLPAFKAKPGMPADLYISTGERTFLSYLMEPVMGSFSKAFREN